MAEILGKDLDLYDDSMVAEKPFNLAESDITGSRFITGEDLARSTRISKEWKDPVAIPAQASVPYMKAVQPLLVGTRAMVDSIANFMPNMANAIAQTSLETMEGEEKGKKLDTIDSLSTITKPLVQLLGIGLLASDIDRKELLERAKTYDEAISLLESRDYPSHNIARRVIAETTSDVESRRAVRELYRQARNIDSSKWYNKAGEIIGAMVPALTLGKGAFGTARAFGAGRLAASRIAQNVAKGYIGVEMGGQYAEETAAQYLERTGDKKFENFTASDATGITAMAYGAIGAQIEMMGGVEPIFAGALNKVGLKSGLLKAGAKIGVGEATEELLQGLTETLMRKIDGSSNKTWREGFMESLNSAAWGLFIGGSLGTASFHVGRANLVKGIKKALPNITDTQAGEIANVMIENTAEVSSQDPTLRSKLREKVALLYRDADIDNKENIIDAFTDLEYGLITMDSAERGIDIAENPIFAGEVNELGWFRDAIPENRREEITALNDEIKGLKDQLAEEQKKEEKNWEKIDELESKLSQVNEYVLDKLSDLARNDAMAVRRMLRETEQKFVNKEKERATKKAIKGGSVDIIGNILSKAGFRTRDLSGTQIKELAKLNWELLQDQNLGIAQSRGTTQIPLANIERNVESGNAVLLRAGYTQDQIDKMDDETWNRAILTQYRKEQPTTDEDLVPDEVLEELPDNFFQSEVFSVADENARLDDIYPEYTGDTIRIIDPAELKQAQYEVIQRTNPMQDEYHVGIRSVNDIKTFDETIDDKDSFVWGDYSQEDAKRDLAKNEITIYSSKPIENGVFVSTSYRQAQEYAGGKGAKVYEKTVPLDYVAWISGDEGQFAITDVIGKKRTVYNSNGERIAKSAEALRNFYKWFGDSKVVDEQGRPLVVYHQTSETFNTFERGRDKAGKYDYETPGGFFFKSSDRNIGIAGNIQMPVYLRAENGIYFTDRETLQKYWARKVDGYADLLKQYQNVDKDYNARVDNIESDMDKAIDDLENSESYKNATDAQQYQMRSDLMDSFDSTALFDEWRNAANKIAEQMKQLVNDYVSANNIEMVKLENDSGAIGKKTTDSFIVFDPTQIKSVDNRGTFSSDTGNIYLQNRVSGAAPKTYRGAYIPEYRFILRANRMDASTLSHELAHDWMEVNFDRFRSGKATPEFMRAWGALEKALGIEENATQVPRKASETFARAYEAWIMTNEDWSKFINIEDKDKQAVENLLKDYQGELRNIYNDMTSKYFKDTWGKLGELKPELKAWFDRAVNITDLDRLVERGEMTEEQATEERLNRAIDKVIENTTDEETANTLRTTRLLNDTARYEVEGGNKNSLQNRLSALAREIDENNTLLKKDRYNTRRDMMQVAEAADNFVKTRLDDALAIINGEMAEVEGLYKEDIYTALERLAIENGDMGLITELKNSEIANRLAKELGQRVAGFRNWKQSNDIDIFSALKSADNTYNKALENKKAKEQFNSALDLFDESLKNQDEKADADLDSTLNDLECK